MKSFRKFTAILMACLLLVCGLALTASAKSGVDDGTIKFADETVYLQGDFNEDGDVNILDLVRMKKYMSTDFSNAYGKANTITYSIPAGDFNGTYEIEGDDLVSLRKLLLGVNL